MENKNLKAFEKKIRELLDAEYSAIPEPRPSIKDFVRSQVAEKTVPSSLFSKAVSYLQTAINYQVKLYQVGIAAMVIVMVFTWQQKTKETQTEKYTNKSSSVKDNAFLVKNFTVSL